MAVSRRVAASVAIAGFTGITLVLLPMFAIQQALLEMYTRSGREQVVIIKAADAAWENSSAFEDDIALNLAEQPFVEREGGVSLIAAESVAQIVELPAKSGELVGSFAIGRGVTRASFSLRRGFRVSRGRMFSSGSHEAVVGRALVARNPNVSVGTRLTIGETELLVVGIFEAPQNTAENEVWVEKEMLQQIGTANNRGGAVQPHMCSSIWLKLTSARDISSLRAKLDSLQSDRPVRLHALDEATFFRAQSQNLIQRANQIGSLLSAVMGLGAVFGTVLTLYSSVAVRSREIATLRTIGFQLRAIAASIVTESIILGLIGVLLGTALSLILFSGDAFSAFNGGSGTVVTLELSFTGRVIAMTCIYVCVLCLISSLFPILSLRGPVVRVLSRDIAT